jgi:hypothetical protein
MENYDVDKAAKYLDEMYPGWYKHIDKDILCMGNPSKCIIGQLFNGNYRQGKKILGVENQPFDWMSAFNYPSAKEFWIEEINSRKNMLQELTQEDARVLAKLLNNHREEVKQELSPHAIDRIIVYLLTHAKVL